MQTIALVACVAQKHQQPRAAQALYLSPWFRKARAYLEQEDIQWYILSAQYGLVSREQVIEPYERTLNTMPAKERQVWSEQVLQQMHAVVPAPMQIRCFAGQCYRQYLRPLLEQAGYQIEVPLEHLGIGQQLAWFGSQMEGVHREGHR
ncbi:hypothetical protein H6F86_26025 [Phormidium sp. FACHB-592]|uniref:DUF6884 domain-containing protein n=1 Tax=Stenomitos frigidus AS-A4 TaxID=2933935 RepID=A0ABV0KTU9_9CYAN|nr:DUF6884 domain-containing protein [Phormidium sp. FACHB-592]MBD2077274.1 hypothetical protein [Phormidium sp. FACHB-592]